MVLFVRKGVWYGWKGICAIVGGIVVGSIFIWERFRPLAYPRKDSGVLYRPMRRTNVLHRLGDLWDKLSR
jgi:hypothetical protein